MTRLFPALLAALLATPALRAADTFEIDNLRIRLLSDTLVRIEQRGPNGFEDRPTFHVTGRDWPGAEGRRTDYDNHTLITCGDRRIRVPRPADSAIGVTITNTAGDTLYRTTGAESNSAWLPAPAEVGQAWAIADHPRIVPPAWGATPTPGNAQTQYDATSGWDTTNPAGSDDRAGDIYVFLPRGDYQTLRRDLLHLVGRSDLPPLYAFGAWDSRWHPYSEASAVERVRTYREHDLPLDVLVIDTDWRIGASHGYGVNEQFFPDMPRALRQLHDENVRVMFNDHPEPRDGPALGPEEMRYRYESLTSLLAMGLDIWWFDRNWSVSLKEPAPGIRKEVWGMRVYRDTTRRFRPDQRPLIMANADGIDNGHRNRPPNVAARRFPIHWTGDTRSAREFIRFGVENAVHEGVHALNAYLSEDVGGFFGNPDAELYLRWFQYSALSPILRPHCTQNEDRAPWAFGDQALQIARDYVHLRYRLLPLLYAGARAHHDHGTPIVARLDLTWPTFDAARRGDQYLLGQHLLIAPVLFEPAKTVPPTWLRTADGNAGLAAAYWDNREHEGAPKLKRVDRQIDFAWGHDGPGDDLPADNFSARWEGRLGPISGRKPVRIGLMTDDGGRMWFDDKLVVDAWRPQAATVTWAERVLQPGESVALRIDYNDHQFEALCRLQYEEMDPAQPGNVQQHWLPPGTWIDLWNGTRLTGPRNLERSWPLEQLPMFIHAGAIIPLAPQMPHTGARPWDEVTLEVWPDAPATFELYEDDGISNAYPTSHRRTSITAMPSGDAVLVEIAAAEGSYDGALTHRAWRVRVRIADDATCAGVTVNGDEHPGWERLKRDPQAFPLRGTGGARDSDVVEIRVADHPVDQPLAVRIERK